MISEKLGAFFLGTELDPATRSPREPLFYDARDLTTHAVCVGMTGSGKTGLCVALIEEALLDGVPVIAIDPKGDVGNLMLTFPRLLPGDFEPWVDPAAAEREGITVGELAARTAAAWREGLDRSGQGADRIERLRAAGEIAIYTPGSDAGLPLSVLRSFRAPPAALRADGEAWRDRIEGAASGLLALIGVAGDPLRSREHVLLSTLLDQAWQAGEDVELAALIQRVVKPPLAQVGAFDLETFFPAAERTKFALELNTLLASPSFAAWAAGEPLEIPRLLFTPEGKPRVAILSIAHLGDAERMFFVTLLLQEVVSWMRGLAGTASLRAILFMDEVAGYLPPSAMPPAKKPMLTLLKQARAYGLGVVLATQNPVDLDYKALSNAGTWWLGRLQTERDQARVLDGLEGASLTAGKAFDRGAMQATLAGLTTRVFVMNNVHDDHPVVFTSRFAMSYLAGPLTRAQIQRLTGPARSAAPEAAVEAREASPTRPVVPGGLAERFIAGGDPLAPSLLGVVKTHHALARAGVDLWRELVVVAPLRPDSAGDLWEGAAIVDRASIAAARDTPPAGARFAPLPRALDARSAGKLDEGLVAWVQREGALRIESVKSLGLTSAPGESAADFRARVAIAAREARDKAIDALREKFRPRLAAIAGKQRTAEERIAREEAQASAATTDSAITIGASVLGALLGSRRGRAGSVASAARSVSRSAAQRGDVARARSAADELARDHAALEADLAAEVAELQRAPDPSPDTLELRPTKGDTAVVELAILWR